MKKLRLLSIVCTLPLFLIFSAGEIRAELVTYQYSGNCFSGSGGDCAFFGLSESDPITGFITLDRTRLSSTAFATFLPTDPDLDFSFTFGNFSVGKNDLGWQDIRVMFLDSTERQLVFQNAVFACLNTITPCNILKNGSEVLSIGTSFGYAERIVSGVETQWAYVDGAWGIVPIPPALWLFGSGLLSLIGIARRKKSA